MVLARASTDPGVPELPSDLDSQDATTSGRAWLKQLFVRDDIRAALRIASPALSHQVEAVLAGECTHGRTVVRLLGSVAAYVRRWQRRATPFGLFAGVAAASVSPTPKPAGHHYRVTARVDARWLNGIIDNLERHPELLNRLPVVTNNAGVTRSDQFVIPTRPEESQPGQPAALDLSVRLTKPVRVALSAAGAPVPLATVANHVVEQFPHVPPQRIRSLLAGLVASRALLSTLRAPMTIGDPLSHLITTLESIAADDIPDVAQLVNQLSNLHDELPRDAPVSPPVLAALDDTAEHMRAMHQAEKVLAVDTALDEPPAISEEVLAEAESAASALLRLTQHPFGPPAWRDYHYRFLARYGLGSRVPVREVVADSGLGFPAGWLGAPRLHSPHMLSERDATLLGLIQQATAAGQHEITLTESVIEQLRVGDHAQVIPPERVELACQVHARSVEVLGRGQFQLWVTGAMQTGSMAGRFVPLLPTADRHRLAGTYAPDDKHTLAAQLSFPPRREHNENITRVPRLLPHVISLAEHCESDDGMLDLDDLAVTADHQSMGLVRISTGQRVRPWVLHALETSTQTPPLARFLAELSSACCGFYGLVDFGAARDMPMLPRLRYGRTVLSPAQWRLPRTELLSAREDRAEWEAALGAWRDRWNIPTNVLLVEGGEQRLPLDLDNRHDRTLLRRRLNHSRGSHVLLRETGAVDDHDWAGRACEFLVPLTASRPTKDQDSRPALRRTSSPSQAHLPGNAGVLRADLLVHPGRADEILTTYVTDLLGEIEEYTHRWWFSRHHDRSRPDSDQYLALFVRLEDPGLYGAVAVRVGDWAARVREAGLLAELTLGTYLSPGGYGDDPGVETAIEAIFAADSAAALAQLTWANGTGLPAQATAAASMAEIAASLAATREAGYRWLCDLLPHEPGKVDRSLREAALRLAGMDPLDGLTMLGAPQAMAGAWQRRHEAVTAYRDRHRGGYDPSLVLRALLREHQVRAVGLDPGAERLAHRLARAVAQRQEAVHGRRGS